ncbi:MAG: hypothetical protein ACI9MC_000375 [Kiritimatiellia bacterium]|jgi:hypothetical protein
MIIRSTQTALAALALLACNPIDESSDSDAGTDTGSETGSDTGTETSSETDSDTATETDTTVDTTPPLITHVPIADDQPRGIAVSIEAKVEDDSDIESVTLAFRHGSETSWTSRELDFEGIWYGMIDDERVQPETMDYWIKATDVHGNMSCAPDDCADSPFSFTVKGPSGPTLDVCKPAHLDAWTYGSMAITGDTLTVDVSYSGGCKEHVFEACWSGSYLKSSPVQVDLELGHDNMDDNCDGWVSDTLTFDLVSLKTDYLTKYPTGKREIVLKLSGKSVSYTF